MSDKNDIEISRYVSHTFTDFFLLLAEADVTFDGEICSSSGEEGISMIENVFPLA